MKVRCVKAFGRLVPGDEAEVPDGAAVDPEHWEPVTPAPPPGAEVTPPSEAAPANPPADPPEPAAPAALDITSFVKGM